MLSNNYQQTLALSVVQKAGMADFPHQVRFMAALEARGLLDRAVETLPSPAALAEREARGEPLTRAELGVLLAYGKIVLLLRHRRQRRAGRCAFRARSARAISLTAWRRSSPPTSPRTGCAARSSRASSPTISSTAAARPS